jgi:hypothetical protein
MASVYLHAWPAALLGSTVFLTQSIAKFRNSLGKHPAILEATFLVDRATTRYNLRCRPPSFNWQRLWRHLDLSPKGIMRSGSNWRKTARNGLSSLDCLIATDEYEEWPRGRIVYLENEDGALVSKWFEAGGSHAAHIHTSGHASPADLRSFAHTMNATQFVPIHGAAWDGDTTGFPSIRRLADGEPMVV